MACCIGSITGAANWRYFEEYAQKEIVRERRSKRPLTLAYFDLDNFKQINDSFGHDVGDDLLKMVAKIIQSQLRPSDMLSRVGGDEFAILLSETGYDGANIGLSGRLSSLCRILKFVDMALELPAGRLLF